MYVLMVVPSSQSASRVALWSRVFAEPGDQFEFICLEPEGNAETRDALESALSDQLRDSSNIHSIYGAAPLGEIFERIRKLKPRLLITGGFVLPDFRGRPQTSEELMRAAPCMTICPLTGSLRPEEVSRILMVVNQGANDNSALATTDRLCKRLNAKVTLATVEDETSTKAERSGERAIQALVDDAGLDLEDFETRVVVDRLRHRGIRESIGDEELIICGFDGLRDIRPLRQSLDGKLTLIVKRRPPLRLKTLVDWFPRINPRDHAELLQDLRQGSQWNNDFISMLALASAIATLGLMQNSPAVVIGSMLLAPLMTPMIGAGLAIAQANVKLAKRCAYTIALGIVLAFSISLLLGLVTPSRETLSPEEFSRGTPNVLDLLIALFAAVAATIAMARPNIAGAIAGVAIATALVPPLCTVGISVSAGEFTNAFGALILFGTNLLAIIVASSFTFALLGVVSGRSLIKHQRQIRFIRWGMVVLLIVLAGPLSLSLLNQLGEGRRQTAVYPLTRALSRALQSRVAEEEGVDITFMGESSVRQGVIIHLAADKDVPKSFADDLEKIVRDKMRSDGIPVYVVCLNRQWMSRFDE